MFAPNLKKIPQGILEVLLSQEWDGKRDLPIGRWTTVQMSRQLDNIIPLATTGASVEA